MLVPRAQKNGRVTPANINPQNINLNANCISRWFQFPFIDVISPVVERDPERLIDPLLLKAMLETGLPKFGVLNRLKTSVRNCRRNRSSIGNSLNSEKSKRVCAGQIHPVRPEGSAASRTPLGLPEILASSHRTETEIERGAEELRLLFAVRFLREHQQNKRDRCPRHDQQ